MPIMVQLTVIVADVVAAQCIVGGNCREHCDYTLDPRWDDAVARAAGLLS